MFPSCCSFQMTAERNDVIAIATRSDWPKKSGASFSTNEKQYQTQSHHLRVMFPAL